MIWHGSVTTYRVDGCRCDACKAAGTENTAKRRAQRVAYTRTHGLPESIEHGVSAYSNWGCRCDVCAAAKAAAARRERARRAAA